MANDGGDLVLGERLHWNIILGEVPAESLFTVTALPTI